MENEILNAGSKTNLPASRKKPKPSSSQPPAQRSDEELGEDEFWKLVE
jgi:hypothetical protein